MTPKVFISYSWSDQAHQNRVLEWAERLINDGIDVVIDLYELKEGQDKYAFMERMVSDKSVTHVLMMYDKLYAEKADSRKAGVGTESQIISKEVYDKVEQTKFIPIVCQFHETGEPFLPTFLKSRIWIDFSSDDSINKNWERLIRLLYGKPANEKPQLGSPPSYVRDGSVLPSNPVIGKLNSFRQAILQRKSGIKLYRNDLLDSCFDYSDALRIREHPKDGSFGEKAYDDYLKLKIIRNIFIDWIQIELTADERQGTDELLHTFLERLNEQKSRPKEVSAWNDSWFQAHNLFVYETFLYIVATLIKFNAMAELHSIFFSKYMVPETTRYGNDFFGDYSLFQVETEPQAMVTSPDGKKFISPSAEIVKRNADRPDINFENIMEGDLLSLLAALLQDNVFWYPRTLLYTNRHKAFPLFVRAIQRRGFEKISIITGITDAKLLSSKAIEGKKRLGIENWHDFWMNRDFLSLMKLSDFNTVP